MNQPGNPAGGETPPSSPSQTHVTADIESNIINEPSPPLNNAGGRREPLGIEEHRQPPLGANQECHNINEQVSPPHHATAGRRTPPSLNLSLGIGEPHQTPRLANQECHIINPPFQPPHHHAAHGRITPPSPSSQRQPSRPHPLRVNQESHTIKKPSSSSEGRRGGVVAPRCSKCKSTSSTQWRSDISGPKWQSLCNACWNGLSRVEQTRAASALQSLNTLWPPPMSSTAILARALDELRNRDEVMEDNANQFAPENNFLRPSWVLEPLNIVPPPPEMPPPAAPEEAPEMEGSGQNCTDKTRENSPEA